MLEGEAKESQNYERLHREEEELALRLGLETSSFFLNSAS